MENDTNRLSILEKLERGEISIEDAEEELTESLESGTPVDLMETTVEVETEELDDADVPTRRERKFALAEKFQNWDPQTMMAPKDTWQWPWPDKSWQWVWQNFSYPVYVSHSIDVDEESELKVVSHQGDLFIHSWDEPMVKINGATFDTRVGQDGNTLRVASSTGQLQIWMPKNIKRVEAQMITGDMWLRSIHAEIDAHCQSGDLGCEQIKGNVKVRANGGDVRLMRIEGAIDADVTHGNIDVRDISSANVSLKSSEGNIWLNLDSVSSGEFRCESIRGDVNFRIDGELSCELFAEASEGGKIASVMLPWQQLLERSENKLHGIIRRGGASIILVARDGKIYIQQSRQDISPMLSH